MNVHLRRDYFGSVSWLVAYAPYSSETHSVWVNFQRPLAISSSDFLVCGLCFHIQKFIGIQFFLIGHFVCLRLVTAEDKQISMSVCL